MSCCAVPPCPLPRQIAAAKRQARTTRGARRTGARNTRLTAEVRRRHCPALFERPQPRSVAVGRGFDWRLSRAQAPRGAPQPPLRRSQASALASGGACRERSFTGVGASSRPLSLLNSNRSGERSAAVSAPRPLHRVGSTTRSVREVLIQSCTALERALCGSLSNVPLAAARLPRQRRRRSPTPTRARPRARERRTVLMDMRSVPWFTLCGRAQLIASNASVHLASHANRFLEGRHAGHDARRA